MSKKYHIHWLNKLTFVAKDEEGHATLMDAWHKPGDSTPRCAPSPMELVAMGLGGCTSTDVLIILKKARQKVTDCEVVVDASRSEDIPRVYTKIHVHFIVTGHHVDEKHVERAVRLSAEKYCSVSRMLDQSVDITHSFEVRAAEAYKEE